MGLDQYLKKDHYIGNNWRKQRKQSLVKVIIPTDDKAFFPLAKGQIKDERITTITEEVGYWRKANQIHNWFINNCGNGDPDEREMYVSRGQLKELLKICKKIKKSCKLVEGEIKNGERVIKNPELAEKLLPTTSGFFFGSTDYDEWYMKDIDYTIEILEAVLSEDDNGDYYYEASW